MEFLSHIPFVKLLGLELQRMQGGEAEVHLDMQESFTNSWGVAHGGVLMTLLDVAMAHAARSPEAAGGTALPGVVTIEMKTAFMRPGEGRLVATGRRLHRTVSLAFCEAFVHDTAGRLLCHASGTFKYLQGLPAGDGRRIQRLNASD
jgi:uncharacterized protein (TIGR00369 family)